MVKSIFKKVCPIHRFSYSGEKCPFCEQERINNLVNKFKGTKMKPSTEKEREITKDDLNRLINKFNKKNNFIV